MSRGESQVVRASRNASNARAANAWRQLANADAPPSHVGGEGAGDGDGDGPNHLPHFGNHTHSHKAYGFHGDEHDRHSHSHSHGISDDDGVRWDNNHDHDHDESDFAPSPPSSNPWQKATENAQYVKHIRFQGGRVSVVNRLASDRRPVTTTALGIPDPLGARLDHHPWAMTWGAYLNAIRDKNDRLGAQQVIRKVMTSRPQPQNAMSERVPSEGGFLLPERLRQQVLSYMTSSIVRNSGTIVPMDSERVPIPVLDNPNQSGSTQALAGLTFSLVQEGQAIPATTPNFGRLALEAWKIAAYMTGVPNELLSDSPAFGDFLARIIAQGYEWFLDDLFLNTGTGVGQPQALVNAPGALAVTRNTSSKVLHADIIAMLKGLHPASKATATWLLSESAFDYLLELYEIVGSAPSGQDVAAPQTLIFDPIGKCWRLLGLPVEVNDHQVAIGSVGDVMLCDLGLYLVGERQEMIVEVAPLGAGFINDTSGIRIKARVDGRYWTQSTFTTVTGQSVAPLVILH